MNIRKILILLASILLTFLVILPDRPITASASLPLFDLALELDGINEYASAPDSPVLDLGTGGDFTIEGFFYVPDQANDGSDTLVWKNGAYGLYILYSTSAVDRIIFRINTDPTNYVFISYDLDLSTGWHHVAASFDDEFSPSDDFLFLFLDGQGVASGGGFDISGLPDSGSVLYVGAYSGVNPFDGWLDEIRFSDIIRYSGAVYTVPATPFSADANTRVLWHFDENWGATTFTDSSGNSQVLTGSNGAHIGNPSGIPPVPQPFGKTYPGSGDTDIPLAPTLSWEPSSGANGYEYCLDGTDNAICDVGWITNSLNTSAEVLGLSGSTVYYWQVRASNPVSVTYADTGTWWSFTTEDPQQLPPTYSVTTTSDQDDGECTDGHCTLREALLAAEADGQTSTIELQAGAEYLLSSQVDTSAGPSAFPPLTTAITITGSNAVIRRDPGLPCDLNETDEPGEFNYFVVSPTGSLALKQVSVQNGCAGGPIGYGGSIYNQGTVTLDASTFTNNRAYKYGGAVYSDVGATLVVSGTVFSENSVPLYGGGAIRSAGVLTITNSTFQDNSAGYSGGAIDAFGSLEMTDTTLVGNSASEGGGIYSSASGNMLRCLVAENEAERGAGIYAYAYEYGPTKTLLIASSTISDNVATISGGGILNNSHITMTLTASMVISNTSAGGAGGISNMGTFHLVDHSVVALNTASGGSGGGISNGGIMNILSGSLVNDNQASNGGGISNAGTLRIEQASVVDNSASGSRGGGIYNAGAGVLAVSESSISGNRILNGLGGGISASGKVEINASLLSNNFSGVSGGGVYYTGQITITNSTIAGNEAVISGGGMDSTGGSAHLDFVTLSENTAGSGSYGGGGGIRNLGNEIILKNSIIADNTDLKFGAPDCSGSLISNGYNLVESLDGCGFSALPTDLTGHDPLLEGLADNGGPTLTYRLNALSPAVDHIPEGMNGCGGTVAVDQRGAPRPQAGVPGQLPACDLGALEMAAGSIILLRIYLPSILFSP